MPRSRQSRYVRNQKQAPKAAPIDGFAPTGVQGGDGRGLAQLSKGLAKFGGAIHEGVLIPKLKKNFEDERKQWVDEADKAAKAIREELKNDKTLNGNVNAAFEKLGLAREDNPFFNRATKEMAAINVANNVYAVAIANGLDALMFEEGGLNVDSANALIKREYDKHIKMIGNDPHVTLQFKQAVAAVDQKATAEALRMQRKQRGDDFKHEQETQFNDILDGPDAVKNIQAALDASKAKTGTHLIGNESLVRAAISHSIINQDDSSLDMIEGVKVGPMDQKGKRPKIKFTPEQARAIDDARNRIGLREFQISEAEAREDARHLALRHTSMQDALAKMRVENPDMSEEDIFAATKVNYADIANTAKAQTAFQGQIATIQLRADQEDARQKKDNTERVRSAVASAADAAQWFIGKENQINASDLELIDMHQRGEISTATRFAAQAMSRKIIEGTFDEVKEKTPQGILAQIDKAKYSDNPVAAVEALAHLWDNGAYDYRDYRAGLESAQQRTVTRNALRRSHSQEKARELEDEHNATRVQNTHNANALIAGTVRFADYSQMKLDDVTQEPKEGTEEQRGSQRKAMSDRMAFLKTKFAAGQLKAENKPLITETPEEQDIERAANLEAANQEWIKANDIVSEADAKAYSLKTDKERKIDVTAWVAGITTSPVPSKEQQTIIQDRIRTTSSAAEFKETLEKIHIGQGQRASGWTDRIINLPRGDMKVSQGAYNTTKGLMLAQVELARDGFRDLTQAKLSNNTKWRAAQATAITERAAAISQRDGSIGKNARKIVRDSLAGKTTNPDFGSLSAFDQGQALGLPAGDIRRLREEAGVSSFRRDRSDQPLDPNGPAREDIQARIAWAWLERNQADIQMLNYGIGIDRKTAMGVEELTPEQVAENVDIAKRIAVLEKGREEGQLSVDASGRTFEDPKLHKAVYAMKSLQESGQTWETTSWVGASANLTEPKMNELTMQAVAALDLDPHEARLFKAAQWRHGRERWGVSMHGKPTLKIED